MKERIEYIDKLKGVAIILVVMGHIAEKSMNITSTPFNVFYGSFHMPLFMFLSGIFAFKNFKEWNLHEVRCFISKKVRRILFPFIVIGGGYSMLFCNNLTDVYIGINSSYWFLPTLFYSMLYALIVNYIQNHVITTPKLYWDFGTHVIFWSILLFLYLVNNSINIPYYLHFVKMYPFFIMGSLFAKYDIIKNMMLKSERVFTISIISYILFLIYGSHIPVRSNYTGVFAIIILANLFVKYDNSIPITLSKIGKYSLEIYVFHWFLLPTLYSWGNWFTIESTGINQNFILLFCVTLILTIPIICVCILLSKIIQRSRFLNGICLGNYQIN